MKIIKFSLQNSLLMNLLTVLIIIAGCLQAVLLQREAFPAIDFDVVSVSTKYPGASPKEVELYITTPIERELKGVTGIEDSNSISVEGISLIIIKLDPDLKEKAKRKTLDDIQRSVDRVSDLPDDLRDPPIVKEANSGDLPIMEVAISGDVPYQRLHEIADDMADILENITNISKVTKKGFREREFWLEVSPRKLSQYNLSLMEIVRTLNSRNINLPGGKIETSRGEMLIRTMGEVKTAKEIENIVLRANLSGVNVKVKDIGRVLETFEDEKETYYTNGKSSINLNVIKSEAGDIISLVDLVKVKVNQFMTNLGDDKIEVSYVNDFSVFVRNRLGVLLNNGFFGIVLVLISLLLMLSPGIAMVTALGMPVAFLGAIALMGYAGMTINLITMFALVIVLGMLVDDAIIVAENIWQHYEDGEPPMEAALNGASEVFWPVTATILTTIAAFSPLLMISGIFGKFIRNMPMVVIFALTMSLIEAMLVLPSHALEAIHAHQKARKYLRRFRTKSKGDSAADDEPEFDKNKKTPVLDTYDRALNWVLRARWLFFAAIIGLFGFSVYFAKTHMRLVLFPEEGVESFFIQADLPIRYSLDKSLEKFKVLENVITQLPADELKDYITTIGKQQNDPNDPFTQRGSHLGQIQVFLTAEKDRSRLANDIINDLRPKIEAAATAAGFVKIVFQRVRNGPPVGKPVAVRLRGDSLEKLNQEAAKIQEAIGAQNGVFDITQNFRSGKEEVLVKIDDAAAARALLTVNDIAQHIRAAFAGQIASFVRSGDDRIGIRVRYPEGKRKSLKALQAVKISNAQGNLVKLSDVTYIETGTGVNAIFHRDFRRSISITASIDETKTTSEIVNKAIIPFLKSLESKSPEISITAGGEWEETGESLKSLKFAFVVALGFIFLILATQFGSITQPFVVMLAIPFGIIGVIWSFYFHSVPLSFLGLIGSIGLSGVIVNDSIVLVDFLNKARDKGMAAFDAAMYAGRRRFRAVWLTTLTTVLGLLPLVYGIGGMDKFLQPAAIALGYGLIFGTVLVLFFIPAIYLIRLDIINFAKRHKVVFTIIIGVIVLGLLIGLSFLRPA